MKKIQRSKAHKLPDPTKRMNGNYTQRGDDLLKGPRVAKQSPEAPAPPGGGKVDPDVDE